MASQPSNGQYFSEHPQTPDIRRTLHVTLRNHELDVQTSHGVFSMNRVDLGTSVLLKHAPQAREHGNFLDLGCGWGPVSLALALESPQAQVYAVDINERAVALTEHNARANHCTNVTALTPEHLPADVTFDLIWSNPPIRVGKQELHALLLQYLTRLTIGGDAYLVVQKNLGADSLITWLNQLLNSSPTPDESENDSAPGNASLSNAWTVEKIASSKGFRIIHVHRNTLQERDIETELLTK